MTTIMVVEDQRLVRDAIATLLSLEEDIDVVAKCEDGQAAIDWLATNPPPEVILSDIEMPKVSGLSLAESLKNTNQSKFVIMTTFAKPGYINRALKAGVVGFILKEADSEYLLKSIQTVVAGNKVIEPELAMMALEDTNPLSTKEAKALALASEGLKTKEVAERLFLSEGTIRNYFSEAISKLNATNRADAARIAKQKGWL
ncbi:response regulator transcription factor [Agaribacter marinus]|uniref:DNA-binding response regulator n=1 Tax=Agaribacter marinus TaxID=1431249 RepID=A0AA37SYN9_9ALTE|nr:response regulator transcription factor [Agaribacter marinus]GLR71692.1 DNA-binding response regulator [Agaribacter marinus]